MKQAETARTATPEATTARASTRVGGVSRWIEEHDDRKLFVVSYILLALVLSIAISLFWLAALVALHFAFEWHKQRRVGPRDTLGVAARATWEVVLDLGLVFFALALAVYMELIFGLLGLSAAARAGAQGAARVGTRVAAWEGVIRGVVLSVDDALLVSRSLRRKKGAPSGGPAAEDRHPRWGRWPRPWTLGERLSFWFAVGSLLLLLLAPLLSPHDLPQIAAILRAELTPFPSSGDRAGRPY